MVLIPHAKESTIMSIPEKSRQAKSDLTAAQWAPYDQLQATEHLSIRPAAKRMHISFSRLQRALKARHDASANGTAPSVPARVPSTPTALESTIVTGEPVSTLPEYPSAPAYYHLQHQVDALQSQVDVLSAFMATIQQHPTYRAQCTASVPEYTAPREWKKSGAEFAVDMPDQLRAYAKAHGRQVREVLDLALRRFFAEVGQEVGDA
jgi:hypothetical protein